MALRSGPPPLALPMLRAYILLSGAFTQYLPYSGRVRVPLPCSAILDPHGYIVFGQTLISYENQSMKSELKIVAVIAAFCSVWVLVLSDDCGQEHLTKCAQPLRVFTDNSEFGLVSTKEELDQICPDLNQGLHCIDRYTRRCMTEQQRFHFNHLYNGTNMVIHEICREGPYQTEFLRHAPCMQEVRTDYEKCAISYQQKIQKIMEFRNNSDSTPLNGGEAKLRTVCCSFQDYLRCSQTTVLMKCGEESAKFTENFLDRVASSLIQIHCEKYPQGSEKCAEIPNRATRFGLETFIHASLASIMVLFHQRT